MPKGVGFKGSVIRGDLCSFYSRKLKHDIFWKTWKTSGRIEIMLYATFTFECWRISRRNEKKSLFKGLRLRQKEGFRLSFLFQLERLIFKNSEIIRFFLRNVEFIPTLVHRDTIHFCCFFSYKYKDKKLNISFQTVAFVPKIEQENVLFTHMLLPIQLIPLWISPDVDQQLNIFVRRKLWVNLIKKKKLWK